MLEEVSFTMGRREARNWLKIVLKAFWLGEYRVVLRRDGKDFRFLPKGDRR